MNRSWISLVFSLLLPAVVLAERNASLEGEFVNIDAAKSVSICSEDPIRIAVNCKSGTTQTYVISEAGSLSGVASLSLSGDLTFSAASAKIIPGATSLLIRNNADSATSLSIANSGIVALPKAAGSSSALEIGTATQAADVTTAVGATAIDVLATGNDVGSFLRGSANTAAARMNFLKSRATDGSGDTIVQSGDKLFEFIAWGSNGTDFSQGGSIVGTVDGTPGATNDMPFAWDFLASPDGSATPASVLKLTNSKNAIFGGKQINSFTPIDVDAQNNTLTVAQIASGMVVHTSVTGGGTVTTDTAANIIAGSTGVGALTVDGQSVEMYYVNDGSQTLTFAGGTGVTISDTGQTITADESAVVVFRRTGASAVTVYIIGS